MKTANGPFYIFRLVLYTLSFHFLSPADRVEAMRRSQYHLRQISTMVGVALQNTRFQQS